MTLHLLRPPRGNSPKPGHNQQELAKGKWDPEPRVFLELLRFKEMLLWITQVIQRLLRADQVPGIDLETYQRVTQYS